MHIMNALICTFHCDYCRGGEEEGGGVAPTSLWICDGVDGGEWVNQVQPLGTMYTHPTIRKRRLNYFWFLNYILYLLKYQIIS